LILFSEAADEITSVESVQFDFGTIRAATDNFSEANKLGKGGFGPVYRVGKHKKRIINQLSVKVYDYQTNIFSYLKFTSNVSLMFC
jgi:hypothetical protein